MSISIKVNGVNGKTDVTFSISNAGSTDLVRIHESSNCELKYHVIDDGTAILVGEIHPSVIPMFGYVLKSDHHRIYILDEISPNTGNKLTLIAVDDFHPNFDVLIHDVTNRQMLANTCKHYLKIARFE